MHSPLTSANAWCHFPLPATGFVREIEPIRGILAPWHDACSVRLPLASTDALGVSSLVVLFSYLEISKGHVNA